VTTAPRREQRSLFGEILDWMLAPLLLLWPMSLALTWVVAQSIADRPYDRELEDATRVLALQAQQQLVLTGRQPGAVRGDLERAATALLRANDEDTLFFQVLGRRGEYIAGDPTLPVPPDNLAARLQLFEIVLRDDVIGDEPVRVASLRLQLPPPQPDADAGQSVTAANTDGALVQVAQTKLRRSLLATEIIKGVILPQFVILPVAVMLVWFALSRGIRPLAELQQRIRRRESTDLSPISERDVPDEVAPLVGAINDLLQRLDRSFAAQRHFLADAAHQLKTPLAGLRMQAELAMREIDSGRGDPQALRHSLQQIARSSQRAAHLVNQLLTMARAENPGQAMRRVPTDLTAVTRDVVRDSVPKALERGIDLGYEEPETTAEGPTWLLAEPVLVGELVRNLVDNALHYTPRGGTVTVRVLSDTTDRVVLLQVEDTGPGIPPAERERVFQPFYRALGTEVEGSGLGLAIVQEIAQHHVATVQVEDARPRGAPGAGVGVEGPGALFTVRFPALLGALAVGAAGPDVRGASAAGTASQHPQLGAAGRPWTSPSGP
jgi:two-component system, OmpR family, sensor histidine kinase TctE